MKNKSKTNKNNTRIQNGSKDKNKKHPQTRKGKKKNKKNQKSNNKKNEKK